MNLSRPFVLRTEADHGLDFDNSWLASVSLSCFNGSGNSIQVVTVFHAEIVPALCFKTVFNIFYEGLR